MRPRAARWSAVALAVAAALLAAALALGWAFSDRFLVPQPYRLQPEFEIIEAGDGSVTLPAPGEDPPQFARTDVRGVYGLRYRGGAGRLGPPLAPAPTALPAVAGQGRAAAREDERAAAEGEVSGDGSPPPGAIVRAFRHEQGRPPRAGDPARVDVTVFRNDPAADHGLAFEEVLLDAPVGPVPAWWLDRGSDTAALMLHGRRRADRSETLRSLPIYHRAGLSVLAASYRNHDDAPASPDGLYQYGYTEVADARAALSFLAERGVRRVVLVGLSMGGALALEALERWPAGAPEPAALVLEAPLLDPRTVIRHGARAEGLPFPDRLADLALAVARLRTGIPWGELDQRRLAPRLALPVLVIAGTGDGTIPIGLVDAFVARLPGEPRYLRLEGVEHMEAWNADPMRYRRAVTSFLTAEVIGPAP